MALITDLPAAATVASTDVFIKDTGSATNKITGTDLATQLLGLGNITTVTTGVVTISTTGITLVSQKFIKFGRVVQAMISISGTIAGGATVQGSIVSAWRPQETVYGTGYYSTSPMLGRLYSGGDVRIRNVSDTSRTGTSGDPIIVTFTYIV